MDEEKKLSELYTDEKQASVDLLKEKANRIAEDYPSKPFTTKDIVLDVIFFFVTVLLAFGWGMLMLLIISFVTLSYLHFDIRFMIIFSVLLSVGTGIYYTVKKINKYKNYK